MRPSLFHKRLLGASLCPKFEGMKDTSFAKTSRFVERCNYKLQKRFGLNNGRIKFGRDGNIIVADCPLPEEMSTVVSNGQDDGFKISLLKDEEFIRWRYNNGRFTYIFYYYNEGKVPKGYIVVRMLNKYQVGYIADYAESEKGILEEILAYIIKMKHFDVVSILNINLRRSLAQVLKDLDFRPNDGKPSQKKSLKGGWPLLVRPAKKNYTERDWYIGGLDARRIENWDIKEICNDGM